jgi:cellulose synthase/poly-beta-1,6-N-acetylglucosamine synthase-like glycosyltransferase
MVEKSSSSGGEKTAVSVGVMAHNEEKNIERLLDSLFDQNLEGISLSEVVVVSSGSTDRTDEIVRRFSQEKPVVRLLSQEEREGKASAFNLFLEEAKEEIIVLVSADLLLERDTLKNLVGPLGDSQVGIVGSHPVPVNDPRTFMGFAAHLLWGLHHQISLKDPKAGEAIAFRKIFKKIPVLSATDEVNIEALVRGQGYRAVYAPEALVRNKGPETVGDFISQRRRIYAGHLAAKHEYSYEVPTLSGFRVFLFLLRSRELSWRFLFWAPLVIVLEIYSRFLGFFDYRGQSPRHAVWQVASSTKDLRSS